MSKEYIDMTVEELREHCIQKGVKFTNSTKKEVMIRRLTVEDNSLSGWCNIIVPNRDK